MKNEISDRLWLEAQKYIFHGTSLFSRGPRITPSIAPKYIRYSNGSSFESVDGENFLDYGMAVGSVLLGHGALEEEYDLNSEKGVNFSLLSPIQVELAKELNKNIPSCDRMKFTNTGSEATESAVRIARIYTKRDKIIHDHYHGWLSWCCPQPYGIPECYRNLSIKIEGNGLDDLSKYEDLLKQNDIAGVVVEPMKAIDVDFKERQMFLKSLKSLCEQYGALLIFDEVACGYRFGLGGAQKFFNVTPHVSAFGKSLSNGYPFSMFCSNHEVADVVEDKLFVSSTYGGNPLSLSAAHFTILFSKYKNAIEKISRFGKVMKFEINEIAKEYEIDEFVKIIGLPQRLDWNFKNWEIKTLFLQEFIRRGIFFGWEIKNSYAHSIDSDLCFTIDSFEEIVKEFKDDIKRGQIRQHIAGNVMEPIL